MTKYEIYSRQQEVREFSYKKNAAKVDSCNYISVNSNFLLYLSVNNSRVHKFNVPLKAISSTTFSFS